MEVSLTSEHKVLKIGEPRKIHLLVAIETWPEEGGEFRKPLNLSLVLDRSGSMGGEKLVKTKQALRQLVSKLSPQDFLSVVVFNHVTETIVPHGPVSDKEEICRRVDSVRSDGTTNLSSGWLRGIAHVLEKQSPQNLSRVVLLTDGVANEGVLGEKGLSEIAKQAVEQGITSTAIGFGDDFNEKDLTAIAKAGHGRFYFIQTPDAAPTVFLEEFGELARVFGQNLEIHFSSTEPIPAPEVLNDLQSKADGRTLVVTLGDVLDHDRRQALFRLDLPALPAPPAGQETAFVELGSLSIKYDAVRGKLGPRVHQLSVKLGLSPEGPDEADPAVLREASLARLARCKRDAAARADKHDFDGARDLLHQALRESSALGDLDPEMAEREEREINAVLAMLGRSEAPSASKSLRTQVSDWSITRVGYSVPSDLDRRRFLLSPEKPERLDDLADHLVKAMKGLKYDQERTDEAVFVLKELVTNAFEHGGSGAAKPQVTVTVTTSRNYVNLVVEDNGKGFDWKALLEGFDAEKGGQKGARGRGLRTVRKIVNRLSFGNGGARVEAVLRKKHVKFEVERKVRLGRDGVNEVPVLKVSGSLDGMTFEDLDQRLAEIFEEHHRSVLLDLSMLEYISSSGVGVVAKAALKCAELKGVCVLAGVRKPVIDVLRLMGLDAMLKFSESVDKALEKFDF